MNLFKYRYFRSLRVIVPVTIIFGFAGCAPSLPKIENGPSTSPSPSVPWKPPSSIIQKSSPQEIPAPDDQIRQKLNKLTLANAVDLALRNNPATKAAWADSRAAAARYGSARADWLPTINVNGSITRSKGAANYSGLEPNSPATVFNASANLSYLLFDFGGRSATIEESRQALLASNWTQNAVIQNTVLDAQLAFFNYVSSKALLEADRTSLSEAEANLAAAEERHRVGLATLADVLQAKTAYSQIKLTVQSAEGQVRVSRGNLALVMGYPANISDTIDAVAPETPYGELTATVDQLINRALANRPDLQAARANTAEFNARIREARSKALPSISTSGSIGKSAVKGLSDHKNVYSGSLQLQIPLFSGFSTQYDIMAAKASAEAAREREQEFQQNVTYQVFSTYNNFITAGERLKTANDFVESAKQSEEVALGRYKEGVGSILDLLSAQQALATARAQLIVAQLNWSELLAQLAHDVGILDLNGDNPMTPQKLSQEVKK